MSWCHVELMKGDLLLLSGVLSSMLGQLESHWTLERSWSCCLDSALGSHDVQVAVLPHACVCGAQDEHKQKHTEPVHPGWPEIAQNPTSAQEAFRAQSHTSSSTRSPPHLTASPKSGTLLRKRCTQTSVCLRLRCQQSILAVACQKPPSSRLRGTPSLRRQPIGLL